MRFRLEETDVFRDGAWEHQEPLILNDGTTIPPPDLPPITTNNNHIGTSLRAMGLTMSGIIVVLSAVCVVDPCLPTSASGSSQSTIFSSIDLYRMFPHGVLHYLSQFG